MSECLKKGYLLKCPQKGFPFKKWNSRWFVLFGDSRHGRVRLEYYDNEKAWQQEKGKRIVPLVHCVSIKPVWNKDYNHVIEIVTSDKTYYLAAGSKDEEKAWFKCLCKTIFGSANRNSIVQVLGRLEPLDLGYHSLDRSIADSNASNSPEIPLLPPLHSSTRFGSIGNSRERLTNSREQLMRSETASGTLGNIDVSTEVGNRPLRSVMSTASSELSSLVSFESGFDDGASMALSLTEGACSYPVTIRPTIGSQKAGMVGTYILQISPLTISLIDIPTNHGVADWPIQYVRRYGRGRTKFSFEASENCQTGKGVFTFNTLEGDAIFHQVDTYARNISSLQHMGPNKDKRISLPPCGIDFKPLNAVDKRTHHSEGKLTSVKHSEYRLLTDPGGGRLTDSAGDLMGLANTSSSSITVFNKALLPSKGRATSELGVIADDESTEKQDSHEYAEVGRKHSRGESELSVVIVNNDPALFESKRMDILGESTESLLENPASLDADISLTRKARQSNSANLSTEDERYSKTIEDLTALIKTTLNNSVQELKDEQRLNELNDQTLDISDDVLTSEKIPYGNCGSTDRICSKPPIPTKPNVKIPPETKGNSINDRSTDSVDSRTKEEKSTKDKLRSAKKELIRLISREMDKENDNGIIRKRKSRKSVNRNKSFEFPECEKQVEDQKQSGSFSAFDFRDHAERPVKIENGNKKLQRARHLSVRKTIQHFEKIQKEADIKKERNGFTLWRAKSVIGSQRPDVTLKMEQI